ncbi:MAG: DMT family transporter [Bifidobacterium tibiigranuli]|jgi:transporter family-2 protein|nr:DMT family transporter [Bifidobacterium tibiigranuli]
MNNALTILWMLMGVAAGTLLPLQNTVNTRLAKGLRSIVLATGVSFAVGTMFLGLVLLALRQHLPWDETFARQPAWIWLGGLFGVSFFTVNIVLMRYFGASITVVLAICGQVIGGLIIDVFGIFDVTRQSLSFGRLASTVLVVIGAILVNMTTHLHTDAHSDANDTARPRIVRRILLPVAGVLGGCLSAAQTTVNGRLGTVLGSPEAASFASFSVGVTCIALFILVTIRSHTHILATAAALPWWAWAGGGVLGALYVLANAIDAPLLGTSLTVSVVLFGQIVGGLTIDHFGLLGLARRPVTTQRVIGAALVLIGIVLTRFAL